MHKGRSLSLSSYDLCSSSLVILVTISWTCSSMARFSCTEIPKLDTVSRTVLYTLNKGDQLSLLQGHTAVLSARASKSIFARLPPLLSAPRLYQCMGICHPICLYRTSWYYSQHIFPACLVSLNSNQALQHISNCSYFDIISKLAKANFRYIFQIINEDIEQYQPQYQPGRNSTSYHLQLDFILLMTAVWA